MTQRPSLRPPILAVALGVAAGLLGMRWIDALIVGLVTYGIGVVVIALDVGAPTQWRPPRPEEPDGARMEVTALTWSLVGRDGRVSEVAVRRLRADATRRLARHKVILPRGLNATSRSSPDVNPEAREQARALLGERAWLTLTAPGGLMPSVRDIAHCVDVIERLGPPATPVGRTPSAIPATSAQPGTSIPPVSSVRPVSRQSRGLQP